VINNYYYSPLSSIPNAGILAPLSRLSWAFVAEHYGTITLKLPVLHDKLGEAFSVDWDRRTLILHPKIQENFCSSYHRFTYSYWSQWSIILLRGDLQRNPRNWEQIHQGPPSVRAICAKCPSELVLPDVSLLFYFRISPKKYSKPVTIVIPKNMLRAVDWWANYLIAARCPF